jgi:hypothetical protein
MRRERRKPTCREWAQITSRRRLTDEEAERVKRLMNQGMGPKRVHREVLGEGEE